MVCKIGERLFICLTMESLWDVGRDDSTAITASLYQAMMSIDYVPLYVARWFVAIGAFRSSLLFPIDVAPSSIFS